MLRAQTLFVVGAGASGEVDMPIGRGFATRIANKVNYIVPVEPGSQHRCEIMPILNVLRGREGNGRNLDPQIRACQAVSRSMPLSTSIDDFPESRRDDQLIQKIGKIGIVSTILDAEHGSRLNDLPRLIEDPGSLEQKLAKTWFPKYFTY